MHETVRCRQFVRQSSAACGMPLDVLQRSVEAFCPACRTAMTTQTMRRPSPLWPRAGARQATGSPVRRRRLATRRSPSAVRRGAGRPPRGGHWEKSLFRQSMVVPEAVVHRAASQCGGLLACRGAAKRWALCATNS